MWCRSIAASLPRRGRLLCAAADASLLPYVHSVSLCAPQSGFLAPARLLPGLFLKRVNDKGEARPIFRIQSTARRRRHVAQICDRLLGCKRLRHRRTDAYRRVRCKGRSLARHLELATLRWNRRRYARKAYVQLCAGRALSSQAGQRAMGLPVSLEVGQILVSAKARRVPGTGQKSELLQQA
jgi:hypothetical protein